MLHLVLRSAGAAQCLVLRQQLGSLGSWLQPKGGPKVFCVGVVGGLLSVAIAVFHGNCCCIVFVIPLDTGVFGE